MIGQSKHDAALSDSRAGKRKRTGCLGALVKVAAILAFGLLVSSALFVFLTPWAFFLGGTFHISPGWKGFGTLHAKSGDYAVYVQFWPVFRRNPNMRPMSQLGGMGYLCSPRGERFRMKLSGDMPPNLPMNTDGEAISLGIHYWPIFTGGFITDHRPSISLRGHWKNPNIEMDDNSSIYRAFEPDGSVRKKTDPNLPYKGEVVPVTLRPGTKSDFEAACKVGK